MSPYIEYVFDVDDEDPYEELREVLAPELADLPPDELEEVLTDLLGGLSPEELEDFWKSLKSVGRSVGQVASTALPGVIKGATTGMAVGGPWGALIGGLGGGALSALQQPSRTSPRTSPRAAPRRPAVATAPRRPTPSGSPATAQLLQTLMSPQVQQSLMSMLLGQAGRSQIPVGGANVPVGSFSNLLGVLLNRAAAEHNALVAPSGEAIPSYLLDINGEFIVDPNVPEERAAALLGLLEQAAWEEDVFEAIDDEWLDDELIEYAEEWPPAFEYIDDEESLDDDVFDALELIEDLFEDDLED